MRSFTLFKSNIMDSTTIRKYNFLAIALLGFCCLSYSPVLAQKDTTQVTSPDYDSLLLDYLYFDSLLLDELTSDSASFLQLLDNLMEEKYIKSAFSTRIGYSGQITNAGRNNTTIVDVGYMGNFSPKWSYWASYNHYFFSKTEDDAIAFPFTDVINASTNYYIKKLSFGIDYSFSFGSETAHRIRLNTSYNLAKNDWWVFDRVSLSPNLSLLMGNASVVNWQVNSAREKTLINRIGMMRYRYLENNDPDRLNKLLLYPVESNAFGIMNYSLFVPVTFTIKKFSLMVNYTLNLPVALPGEELDTSLNNYLSTTLIFTF